MTNLQRKIIHIDMDAFYAAVEQRDNPQYRNKAIIVGGNPNSRGVVATCSYEARQFGVHSAMPSSHAYRLCPQAIFVKPRFSVYQETSAIIREIFSRYSDKVEPLSLDEAYLDVTDSPLFQGSATLLAKQIKAEIYKQTQLIASAGISYNKFLAKLASDYDKPDGLFLITPEQGETFIEQLSIGKFHGIGPATEQKMHQLGIFNGHDLKQVSLETLQQHFGKAAEHYFNIARGIDHRQVNSQRIRKSMGGETTFQQDLDDPQQIIEQLHTLFEQNLAKLKSKNQNAYTLTIKIKFQNFVQITRGKTLSQPIKNDQQARLVIADLLKNTGVGEKKVRLLGITLSGLEKSGQQQRLQQMDLFESF